jgi:hypothetical protein
MYLTKKGRGLIEELSGRRERFDRGIGMVLSPEELRELRRMLGALAEAAQDWGRMGESGSNHKTVIFVGLMLGMLVAAVSQTIVSSVMPVIVAELGGIDHYS